jgi:hypothetical protein
MDRLLRYMTEASTMTLAEAAEALDVSEERVEQLAQQGLIRASEEPEGWRFESMSVVAYLSDEVVRSTTERVRQYSVKLAEDVGKMAQQQYQRGKAAGGLEMAKRMVEEVDRELKSLTDE